MNDDPNAIENTDQNLDIEPEQVLASLILSQPILEELNTIEQTLQAIALQHEGDTIALLALLRRLESMHGQIRDTLFQASLPNNRQRLYALLRDIELEGGWPYIPRMKLQRLLANFQEEEDTDASE